MRKVFIVSVLAIVLTLAFVGIASANAGPHGGYSNTTAACAGCHRAHTAVGELLLVRTSVYELCVTCHGSTGSGANTDVLDGIFITRASFGYDGDASEGKTLNGGGFLRAGGTTDTPTAGTAATSAHNVDGLPAIGWTSNGQTNGKTAPAWGGGQAVGIGWTGTWSGGDASSIALECTSCHNPHGSTNYRILNDYSNNKIYGATGAYVSYYGGTSPKYGVTEWQLEGGANSFQDFQVLATPSDTGGNRYANWTLTGNKGIMGNYTVGMNAFCGTCHQRYYTATEQPYHNPDAFVKVTPYTGATYPYSLDGAYDAGDGNGAVSRYRHPVGYAYSGYSSALMPVRLAVTDANTVPRTGTNATWTYTAATDSRYVTCLTCHFAHGTTAQMSSYAVKSLDANGNLVDNPTQVGGAATGVAPANDSALLFYDNRGVCQNCHRKTSENYNNY